jgi:hypothetical protein
VYPDPFLLLQLGHQPALANEESRISHWNASVGDLATGCSSVCQDSFVPINFNTLTLPQIEPASNTDTGVTQTEIWDNLSSSHSEYTTSNPYDGAVDSPSLVHPNQIADILTYPSIPLPVFSSLELPYQVLSSVSAFPYEPPAGLELSNHSHDPNPQGDTSAPKVSYPLFVDTTPSNNPGVLQQTGTGPLLIENQTPDKESISLSGSRSLCAPSPLEFPYNSCMDQLNTYPSTGVRKTDAYRPTLSKAYLISPNDTFCKDQTGAYKCDFMSPVTGESCSALLSRVYDCSRHKDPILDCETSFKCHLCPRAYKRKNGLSKHMRKKHTGRDLHHRYPQSKQN